MKQSAIEYLVKQLVLDKKISKADLKVKMAIDLAIALEKENILDAHYETGKSLPKAQSYYIDNYGRNSK